MPHFAYATALLALFITGLSLHVSRLRLRHRVSLGDGGHRDLAAAVRAHGNALEQSLLFLVLLAAAESLPAVSAAWLQAVVLAFVMARVAHAGGLLGRRLPLRQIGHLISVILQLVLAGCILVQGMGG